MIGALLVWSNHFDSSFHVADRDTIVENHRIQDLGGISRFFRSPRTFSDFPERAEYRPLLSTTFGLDYRVGQRANPVVFQADSFVWFLALLFLVYALFRLIPGATHQSALFGAAVFGVHPLAAETLNYVIRRGAIIGAFGVVAALVLRIVWPLRLPPKIWVNVQRTPENWQEDLLIAQAARINRIYTRFINLPLGLYLIPITIAMLADPGAFVFAPLLLLYIAILEPGRGLRSAIPASLVCGVYWIAETAMTWRFAASVRTPFLSWIFTQPWIATHYVFQFLAPVNLNADSGLRAFDSPFAPLALAGYLGLAGLIRLAIITSRRAEWRAVSFGIWWYLVALAPTALIPGVDLDPASRFFLPAIGLALAGARTAWILFARLTDRMSNRPVVMIAAGMLCGALLCTMGWQTWERNKDWDSEQSLWMDSIRKNPANGKALLNYASSLISAGEVDEGRINLKEAAPSLPPEGPLETDLAIEFDALNMDTEAETHFRRALSYNPSFSRGYASYARWLLSHRRNGEAFTMASKAVELEPEDLEGRHTLMDIYSQRFAWADLEKVSTAALRVDPGDVQSQKTLLLAQSTLEQLRDLEKHAKAQPTVDEYLNLSVVYFHNRRFADCIKAAREAAKLRPDLPQPWANMAIAYHNLGKIDDAIAAMREAIRLKPDLPLAQVDLNFLLAEKSAAERK